MELWDPNSKKIDSYPSFPIFLLTSKYYLFFSQENESYFACLPKCFHGIQQSVWSMLRLVAALTWVGGSWGPPGTLFSYSVVIVKFWLRIFPIKCSGRVPYIESFDVSTNATNASTHVFSSHWQNLGIFCCTNRVYLSIYISVKKLLNPRFCMHRTCK